MIAVASLLLGNQWARLAIAVTFAIGFGFIKGFQAVPKVDIAAIERNAISGRDAEWERKLAEANQHHDQLIAAALEAAQNEPAVSADRAGRVQLCASDARCRDKDRR